MGITNKDILKTVAIDVPNMKTQLDSIETQQINDILNIKNPQIETTKQPILVFVDDDTRIETYTFWHRLAQEKGIKISLGVVPEWIETGSSTTTVPPGKVVMTKAQLKEMYDYGHDLLSHGYDTRSIKDFLNNPTELKHQLLDSKQWLIDNGYTRNNMYDYFVYPQGLSGTTQENLLTKAEVRKYYRYGINAFTTEKNINGVFDSYNIPRVTGDGANASTLKAELDKIIANKGMMIVLSHAWHSQDQDGGSYDAWADRYKQLIDYARANNVAIIPFSEAIKIKGNVFSIGEFTDLNNVYINNDGTNTLAPQAVKFRTTSVGGYSMNDDLSTYDENTITYVNVQGGQDTLTSNGGLMMVVNAGKHMSYAIFTPYNSDVFYKRRYNELVTPSVWLSWVMFSPNVITSKKTLFALSNSDFNIIGNNAFQKINLNSVAINEIGGTFNTSNFNYTFAENGYFTIEGVISIKTNTTSDTEIMFSLFKNNSEQCRFFSQKIANGSPLTQRFSITLKITSGDVLDMRVKSSADITISGNNGAYTSLSIIK